MTACPSQHHSALNATRMVLEYAISMGSNLGDRVANMRMARDRLKHDPDFTFVAQSPLYDTEPVDVSKPYHDLTFLNAVIVLEARIAPHSLLLHLRAIESDLGRIRTSDPNAPRPIDLDILYAGDLAVTSPDLTVPHPRWQKRRFVVQPLADVRPRHMLPDDPRCVADVLADLPEEPRVILFAKDW